MGTPSSPSVVSSPLCADGATAGDDRSRVWLGSGDDAVHCGLLGRMAACNRLVRGESLEGRAARAGLSAGQLAMAERGMMMAPATADALLSVCGYHRLPFTRRYLGPALRLCRWLDRDPYDFLDDDMLGGGAASGRSAATEQQI